VWVQRPQSVTPCPKRRIDQLCNRVCNGDALALCVRGRGGLHHYICSLQEKYYVHTKLLYSANTVLPVS
jgi:hypothetical protein